MVYYIQLIIPAKKNKEKIHIQIEATAKLIYLKIQKKPASKSLKLLNSNFHGEFNRFWKDYLFQGIEPKIELRGVSYSVIEARLHCRVAHDDVNKPYDLSIASTRDGVKTRINTFLSHVVHYFFCFSYNFLFVCDVIYFF